MLCLYQVPVFNTPPVGFTPLAMAMDQCLQQKASSTRPLLLIIATDGQVCERP
jgi:hypothetical protein